VENAFRVIGADVQVVKDAAGVAEAQFVVLPGVGSYAAGAARLQATGLMPALRSHALTRKLPLVGLCLGMQLMAESSEEHGVHEGLGLIRGKVVRLDEAPPQFRVPNIGWRTVALRRASALLPLALDGRSYYHVHSFHLRCTDPLDVAGFSRFGDEDITSIVHRANVFGTQFHPEKSQDAGLDLLYAVWNGLR
jgi:imidazole glycerol-phosphate synthase subunit HisH